MFKPLTRAIAAALALIIAPAAFADGPGDAGPDRAAAPVRAAPLQPAAQTQAPAEGRTGIISLNDGEVTLNVPNGYRFYPATEAYAYLQRSNAAAPSGAVLGLIARSDADIRSADAWATVVSYDAIGYVQPETASGLSNANFEEDVRAARRAQSRAFEGFASPPAFDAAAPQVVWAERAAAPGAGGKDFRYEQKTMGRYGVACLTSIGAADQMDEIVASAANLQAMLSFPEGRRHADFAPASDQVSSYSVPGLVTGVPASVQAAALPAANGQAQTAFGGLAGWFPWIALGVIVVAIGGYMLMRKRDDDEDEDEDEDDDRPAAEAAAPEKA
ncbi:MAG: DUF2167 domain-containing protein [Hyphomonadaceae bacterium]|nr:DUF2167 domain-containing protein [Hyphomonadaceae bacterium]